MPIETLEPGASPHRYITTAIPYVNAAPHVGFALEMVQADALARFYRQSGNEVRFQAGTDENSIKNVQAANIAGIPVAELVQRNALRFLALKDSLDLSFDDFIRTGADPRHRVGTERLWKACCDNGDTYKSAYRGLYCTGCEQFYGVDDLHDGRCPEHGTIPETVEEENWFFRLSRYRDRLRSLYARGEIEIVPESRRNEVLAWIEQGLTDFSISRSAARAGGWGIPVPGDPAQVIYVWFDALGSYVTGLGYGSDEALLSRYWTGSASREHVIGKGITRFHAVYWPAMLLSAGLPVPTRILVHGYVTAEGRKIGKSAGNAIDPVPLAAELGTDALRYYLLRHIRSTGDGDFSHERFRQAYESELAGQLGNLAHRVLSMIERYCGGILPAPPDGFAATDRLSKAGRHLNATVAGHLQAFAFDHALDALWLFIAEANRYVSEEEPWILARKAASGQDSGQNSGDAAASLAKLHGCLFSLAGALQTIAECIAPLLPAASRRLSEKLGKDGGYSGPASPDALIGTRVAAGAPLFPMR
ncbi:methionine--tRNA ligase [Bosea sp. LjRoot9]|uniref:methionine--tRNA ligase n=1 Tax=Bosea sp. LjRoot9 TaxID=3342341 RepID=UPI003ED1446D